MTRAAVIENPKTTGDNPAAPSAPEHPLFRINPDGRVFGISREGYDLLRQTDLWNQPVLPRDTEFVVGYTGPRGGGKSCAAAYVTCHDYLFRGKPVWSNIPIKAELTLPNHEVIYVESDALDTQKLFGLSAELTGGLVLIDELELYAEARRSQSNKNLLLNYIIMQIRKRSLSFFYTIQQPQWIDNRLQFMSDLMWRTRDAAFTEWGMEEGVGRGLYFSIEIEDWSGMLTGQKYQEGGSARTMLLRGKPVWPMYNSYDTVDVFEALTPIDLELNRMNISNAPAYGDTPAGQFDKVEGRLAALYHSGRREILDSELWNLLGADEGQRRSFGQMLKANGYTKKQTKAGWVYNIPEYENPAIPPGQYGQPGQGYGQPFGYDQMMQPMGGFNGN